ncbi:hypothetical protein [uncultured Ruminobacter sp.]|nr:hypothetical protein [uncultured Ruminobacter sp.]
MDRIVYDIAVIGLGPAGSTFARLVDSRKLRVNNCLTKSINSL